MRIKRLLSPLKRMICFDESRVVYNGRSYKSYWDEFYGQAHGSFFSRVRVKFQARRAFIQDGFRPDEFCLHGLENKNKDERSLFLSQKKKDEYLISYYGPEWRDILALLKDKYLFYSYLKELYKREVICIKSEEDRLPFVSFCNQHHHIFAKQNKGRCGLGVKRISITDEEQANAVFNDLISYGEWIIEEVINQAPEIAVFNPSSINTVRFPSFKKDGIVKCAFPCFRIGRAGSIVDNAAQGGLIVSIDEKTGELFPNAYDEKGNVFASHPDSNIPFRGFQIPQWDSLVDLIKRAHLALPDNQVYVAFDLAFSDSGWCVVEGNWGDLFLQQLSQKKGLRKEFVSLLFGAD